MQDSRLQNVTLLSWTLRVWTDFRRGAALTGHEAAIGQCMQHHTEWWSDWEALDATGSGRADISIENRLVHIHHDAAVKLQLENKQPPEAAALYDMLLQKGFTEFEAIHTLAVALTEETWYAREHNENFDTARYVERANGYVKQALSRPNMTRITKQKSY